MYFKKFSLLILIALLITVSLQPVVKSQDKNPEGAVIDRNILEKDRYMEKFQNMSSFEIVRRVWNDVCAINRDEYPDSNLVLPGQTIKLPLDKFYVAKPGGTDHMWQASVYYTNEYVIPYLQTRSIIDSTHSTAKDTVLTDTTSANNNNLIVAIIALAVLLLIVALVALKNYHSRIKAEDELKEEKNKQPVVNPPFVNKENIPSFHSVSDYQLRSLANESLGYLYKNFSIIGAPIKGLINGEGINYFQDGSKRKETFKNTEGYKVRVRFEDGHEENVYNLYSCCNPLWGLTHSDTGGITFTPLTTMNPELIPTASEERIAEISEVLKGEKEKFSSPIGTVQTDKAEKIQPEVDPGFLTKVSLPNHVAFEGNIPLNTTSVKLIKELIQAANNTGKNKKDEKKDSKN